MARVVYAPAAFRDFERLLDFLLDEDPAAALATVPLITQAVAILQDHPLIGHTTTADLRELVISRGNSGYIALYDYRASQDIVVILSIRHQREAGFPTAMPD
ncbi:MAG: addiction module toxin RelE [Betaproteobacteria bacterium]|nr:addiction module toxin RelE [Betaproteobacteria bacterium]